MPHVDTPQSLCRFGIARGDITPPPNIYHRAWGAAGHDRATGVHRPLTATAAVFRSADGAVTSDTEQVVLAVDHCLLWAPEMERLLGSLHDGTGLAPGQVVVAFSHTHGAGLMGRERLGLPGGELIPPYLDELAHRLTALVRAAQAAVLPVCVTYATGRCSLAAHRDYWDEGGGRFVCGYNPGGPADDTVIVARVSDPSDRPLATFVNYACHPTSLAWENTLISPDYPGAMREVVEKATGVPCLFLQGASGDLGPREGFVGDPAVADRNGRQLGYAALAALESLPPPRTRFEYAGPVVSGATLGTWRHVPLSPDEVRARGSWRLRRWTVDLPYRPGLPTIEQIESDLVRSQKEEEAALRAGAAARARDGRAMVERVTRRRTCAAALPRGEAFPLPVTLWRMGDAFWLAVEAEHYQYLQQSLRARFPEAPVVVITLANGWRASYLPTADTYGKGIYQESIAVLAPGCLEALTDAIATMMAAVASGERRPAQ